jgi:hypothetical protein
MKGPNKRINARYCATYTIREAKRWLFMNHSQDRARQAKNRERLGTTSNWCHPH